MNLEIYENMIYYFFNNLNKKQKKFKIYKFILYCERYRKR